MKIPRDLSIIGEIIEAYLVFKFDDINLAGSVTATEENEINYIGINLAGLNNWDQNAENLVNEVAAHVRSLFTERNAPEWYCSKYNSLTFNVSWDAEDDYNKNIQLFHYPEYYDDVRPIKEQPESWFKKTAKSIWFWPSVLTGIIITILIISIYYSKTVEDPLKQASEINQKITFVTGIFGSFILTFLMTRVLNLRQEKLKRGIQIRALCEKISLFRKICFHLLNDHRFWKDSKDYKYATSIRKKISYDDARFLDVDNDVKFNHHRAIFPNDKPANSTHFLYLQLWTFAKMHTMGNLNLLYTNHPPLHIYSLEEIEPYLDFTEYNEIWNHLDNNNYVAEYNPHTTQAKNIVDASKRFDPVKFKDAVYNKETLLDVADEVQNDVLPNLYYLLKLNEAKLPISIQYYFVTAILIISLSVIYPVIFYFFFSNPLMLNVGSILLVGIFCHILLMLRSFLVNEHDLKRPDDYR